MSKSQDPQHRQDEQEIIGLKQYEQQWHHIQVPHNKLDQAVYLGMERGRRKRKWIVPLKWSGIAASLLIVILLSSIRLSPTVAAYVSQIPGMESIVNLIAQDKGLRQAVEHDWIQTIDAAAEHEGITLRVDQIILDADRLILFYTIENNTSYEQAPSLSKIGLIGGDGEALYDYYSSWDQPQMEDEPNILHGKVEFGFNDEFHIPDQMTFHASMDVITETASPHSVGDPGNEITVLNPEWSITFDIDREKFQHTKKVYEINQTVVVEGQRIHFHEAIVYPTRTSLIVEFDAANTKKIFGFDDIRLVNEQGEEFRPSEGVISTGGERETFYFESNFFDQTEILDVKFSSLRALDKDQLEVVLDLEQQQFIKKPDERLQFEAIHINDHAIDVRFKLQMDPKWDMNKLYTPLALDFTDMEGNEFSSRSGGSGSSPSEGRITEGNMILPKEDYDGPLVFTIWNYPTRIERSTSIRINLKE